jgi:hypothetical protein
VYMVTVMNFSTHPALLGFCPWENRGHFDSSYRTLILDALSAKMKPCKARLSSQ